MTERFGEFIDEINQLSPYKVSLKERGCYSFKTHNDKTYNIYFFQNEFFKRKEIVDLTIERMNDIIAPVDLKVRQTVVSIISILLNNLKDNFIIILSYDNIDGKSFKRYRVFDKWFSGQGIIYKYDKLNYEKSFISFICNKNNKNIEDFQKKFEEMY